MVKCLLFLLFIVLQNRSAAQIDTLKLPLEKRLGSGPFKSGFRVTYLDDTFKAKGVPECVEDFIIKYVTFRHEGTDMAGTNDYESTLYFLVGFKSDSIAIAVDCNGNTDFSDEKLLLFPKDKVSDAFLPTIDIPVKLNQLRFNYTIQLYPYPANFKYASAIEQKHYLLIRQYEYKTSGKWDNNNPIYVFNSKINPYVNDLSTVEFAIKEGNDNNFKHYAINDNFIIGNTRYIFQSVNSSLDTLVLLKAGASVALEGYTEGLLVKPFSVKDIGNRNLLLPLKDKYTLIDFWGTWCVPCRELTPQLKAIYKKFQPTLDVVSVAFDDDVQSVKSYVSQNKLLWHHIQEPSKENQHPTIDQFNVKGYPTFVLIGLDGKIIIRGEGKETLEKIETALKEKSP